MFHKVYENPFHENGFENEKWKLDLHNQIDFL